jgi:hypothetical protein
MGQFSGGKIVLKFQLAQGSPAPMQASMVGDIQVTSTAVDSRSRTIDYCVSVSSSSDLAKI